MPNVWTLVVIMIVVGIIGGAVSHLLVPVKANGTPIPAGSPQGGSQPSTLGASIAVVLRDIELYKAMVIGIAAVFLVPLFFNLINYQSMENVFMFEGRQVQPASVPVIENVSSTNAEATNNYNNLMLFISYCLVAAISSKKFIQLITNKTMLSLQQEIEGSKQAYQDLTKQVSAVMDPVTEDEKPQSEQTLPQPADGMTDSAPIGPRLLTARPSPLTPEQNSVLQAIAGSRYIFRTMEGICEDCGLNPARTTDVLRELIGQKLVEQTLQAKGLRFHITAEGKKYA